MTKILSNFSDRARLLLFVLLLVVISLLITFFLTPWHTVVMAVTLVTVLWISRPIWLPKDYGKNIIRKLSLSIALAVAASFSFWSQIKGYLINQVIVRYFPDYSDKIESQLDFLPVIVMLFVLCVIWIVNYLMRDKSAMGIALQNSSEELYSKEFVDKMIRVCDSLKDDLRSIDIQTNWSIYNFVPLEAEVEIRKNNGNNKKITDLLTAIKKSKDRLFLVLGDPGSGKSVALRKLATELIDEVKSTKKIPVYINLREWRVEDQWTNSSPPTIEDFARFIKTNLKSRDIITSKFFDKYFDKLYENGSLYFILDSFDEIPSVLSEVENSELIRHLSNLIFKFLKGARDEQSQGILASRIFRRPSSEFQSNTVLEIRPFNEDKIVTTLKKSNHFNDKLIKELFKKRLDLIPVSRNPFTLALISDYVENNNYQLPENQLSLYQSYIMSTLQSCGERIQAKGLTVEEVIDYFKVISDYIFENYGIEAPINRLKLDLPDIPVADVLDIVSFAKVGRIGVGDNNIFSYAHRRFCEYFAVQYKIDKEESIDLSSIPQDSQWRDALVLYCEVVDEGKAKEIARFCWGIIQKQNDLQSTESLHSLRFLNDAFKGRLNVIDDFRFELFEYINNLIAKESNILSIKLAIESVGLLHSDQIDKVTITAFNLNNSWLNETCLRSCRHLSGLSSKLDKQVIRYLNNLSIRQLAVMRKDLRFSLMLTTGFKNSLRFLHSREIDLIMIILGGLVLLISFPIVFLSLTTYYVILLFVFKYLRIHLIISRKVSVSRSDTFGDLRIIVGLVLLVVSVYALCNAEFSSSFREFLFDYDSDPVFQLAMSNNIIDYSLLSGWNKWWSSLLVGVLLLPVYRLLFYNKLYYRVNWKKVLKMFFVTLISLGFVGGFVYILDYLQDKTIFLLATLLPVALILLIRHLYLGKKKFDSINLGSLVSREKIYESYILLDSFKFYQDRLISYIEANVKEVSGQWPDQEFLNVSNDSFKIRIAKLEEKWLRLNR